MQKEYKTLLSNTGLLAIGSIASSLLGMFLIPLYTAVLSTAEYGIYDLIVTTTSLLYPFMTLAIGEAIVRFALDKNNDRKTIYTLGLLIVLTGGIFVSLFSFIIEKSAIRGYTIYFIAYFICYCLHTITSYFVKGIEAVGKYAAGGLINSIVFIGCNLLFLVVFKWGIKGYLLSSILGHAVTVIFLVFSAKTYLYVTVPWKMDRAICKSMLKYSVPMIPNSISWWISNSSDKYMLAFFSSASVVGIYSISYRIPTIMMTLMGFFLSAWQLSAVKDFGTEHSQRFYETVLKKYFALNILLALTLIAFSKLIGSILFSKDFFVAWQLVPILITANLFNVLTSFYGSIYISAKKTKMLSVSTVTGAAANIILNLCLIPLWGAAGAAIATAAAYMLMYIMRKVNTKKIMVINTDNKADITAIALVIIQTFIVCMNFPFSQLVGYLLLGAGVVFYRKELGGVLKLILDKVKNIR